MITVIESILGDPTVDSSDPSADLPASFSIHRVYPNPFNAEVTVEVNILEGQAVELDIVDMSGRWVDTLYAGWLPSGFHRLRWSPSGHSTGRLGSGVYLAVLRRDSRSSVEKLVLIK
ncbi:MAG: T9SS type A sorting domain-containing protein [Fidelibacterota bacterium]